MVKLENAVIARIVLNNQHFEVLVDPHLAMKLRQGGSVDWNELLAVDTVFKDAKKGEEQSPEEIKKAFGTDNVEEVAKRIILKGDVQLTTELRREMREKRKREIIELIVRNAYNPQTQTPHPPQRIEKAIDEAGVQIDIFKSAKEQLPTVLDAIRTLLPISMEKLALEVKVPPEYAGRALPVIHGFEVKKEEWRNDGSLYVVVTMPAGLKVEFLDKISKATAGKAEVNIVE
jgi:ribosome maturation protein SDO1